MPPAVMEEHRFYVADTIHPRDVFDKHVSEFIKQPVYTRFGIRIYQRDSRVFEYPIEPPEEIAFCFNIIVRGKYFARLIVQGSRDFYIPGRAYFVECLGELLTQMFTNLTSSKPFVKDYFDFRETIRLFLQGHFQDRNIAADVLKSNSWLIEHQYQVMKFEFEREGYMSYYSRQVEGLFGNCCAVYIESGIYCVVNLSLNAINQKERIQEQLPYFLRDNLCKAGISAIFNDIFQLSTYRRESEIALALGEKYDEHFWYYKFENYVLQYITEQATVALPIHNICHPSVELLKKYDDKNGTQLTQTLYQLIKSKYNITHAADKLFIHRTTFIQRLSRIKHLTGVDLNDYVQRLHIMLTFHLMS